MNPLYKILERPCFASFLVGTLIHTMIWGATWVLATEEVMQAKLHLWQSNPLLFTIVMLIPYLVPFTMMTLSRRLTKQKIQSVMSQFPEMNPDIVLRLSPNLELAYINPAGKQFCRQHHLSKNDLEQWLRPIVAALHPPVSEASNKALYETEAEFKETTLHFRLKQTVQHEWFISARNISEQRQLQKNLQNALLKLTELTDFQESALGDYDPLNFNFFDSVQQMLSHIYASENPMDLQLPDAIFCTLDHPDSDRVTGQIFQQTEQGLTLPYPPFELEKTGPSYAISKGKDALYVQTWQADEMSLDAFQAQFNPKVRSVIYPIQGYVAYKSGYTSVIGFYKHTQVQETASYILKSIAIISESLNRISLESQEIFAQFKYTLDALARAAEANDEDTGDHILRLNEYSYLLAKALEMDDGFCNEIRLVAMMHDVGKIHIDPHVLKKPGKLTPEEMNHIKAHPEFGGKILGKSPLMKMAYEIALYHHERYDGSGYPFGLKGSAIPIAARIVSIADVYDALRQERVYKPGFSHEKAYRILTEGDGRTDPSHFDPKVLDAFKKVHHQLDATFNQMNK
ncbi:MAG: HD-GYP domain-containing protein [Hydrogenovibrio sp.]